MEQKVNTKREWNYDAAIGFAANFADQQFRAFISDDIIKEFYKNYHPPREPRVWGGIMSTLKISGKIKAHGARMGKPCTGGNRKWFTVWISKKYSDQQSVKRRIHPEPMPSRQIEMPLEA